MATTVPHAEARHRFERVGKSLIRDFRRGRPPQQVSDAVEKSVLKVFYSVSPNE
jgi:hypothetical protein